jgi:hypothetical protein
MSRTKWTTILTIAVVATLLAALATPVSAKKPDKPTPTVEVVEVSMGFVGGSSGLATTDACGGTLEMKVEAAGRLRIDWTEGTGVEMNLPGLSGCHGWLTVPEDAFAGYFILASKPGGTVELTSRFDYIWGETATKGKKPRIQFQDLYQINVVLRTDGPFVWTANGEKQEVTGELELRRFIRQLGGWQEPTTIVEDFVMTITISPEPTD